MLHLKVNGRLMTINEIAKKFDVPRTLIASRYQRGIRELDKLIQPKYEMTRK